MDPHHDRQLTVTAGAVRAYDVQVQAIFAIRGHVEEYEGSDAGAEGLRACGAGFRGILDSVGGLSNCVSIASMCRKGGTYRFVSGRWLEATFTTRIFAVLDVEEDFDFIAGEAMVGDIELSIDDCDSTIRRFLEVRNGEAGKGHEREQEHDVQR